ncbi:MAG: DUF4407 domain-containing protein [Flavobacteriales bacterium]|nr:DUF4407 domain-containing protein [Flavobacteriales bacterium]
MLKNSKGEVTTTGIYGRGPSAENKIKYLEKLQSELSALREENKQKKLSLTQEIQVLKLEQSNKIQAYTVSADYLKREIALEQLKDKNSIVVLTQNLLILLFILVDILPFIFKTFSPFGMYDRIVLDDEILIHEMDNSSRKAYLQRVYHEINS